MTTIEIATGITLTARPRTIRAIDRPSRVWRTPEAYKRFTARREAEARERANEAALSAWLRDPANWGDPLYSDIYKDVYGVRPR